MVLPSNGFEADVVVVGAGPVGLTLAIALGHRGVRTILLERKEAPEFLPKMERCNARTLEIFRRMGLADKIRAARAFIRAPVHARAGPTLPPENRTKR